MDPYRVLGVSRNATDDEIKKAYRKLSRKYHPDANVNNPNKAQAEEQFKRIQQAYKQIMDERSGASYGSGTGSYQQGGYNQGYNQGYGQGYNQQGYGRSYSQDGGYSQGSGQGYGGWWGGFGGPFGGFGGYGRAYGGYDSGANEAASWGDDEVSLRLKGAVNYINNGSYNEAINTLNSISNRDARWYYVHALADSGLGNTSAALENATVALQMDPDNVSYQSLYSTLRGGGAYYAGQGQQYGRGAGMNQRMCMLCLGAAAASSICAALSGGAAGMSRGVFCC